MLFRSAGLFLVMALIVTGCTRTAMYHPPGKDDAQAKLSIQSDLGSNEKSSGWRMPGAGESTVAIFKVDGERLSEKGGDERVSVEPGERSIEIFADHQGILRFGTLSHRFKAGGDYLIVVSDGDDDKRYSAVLIPNQGSGVVDIYDETRF